MKLKTAMAALAMGTALFANAPSQAESVNVTAVAGHPPVFLWVKLVTEAFIPTVNKELEGTGHTVNWTESYGGSLAKVGGELEAMEEGLAEIGIVSSLFEASNLPLQNVSYVTPFGSPDPNVVFDALDELHETIPDMRKLWEKYDLEYLSGGFGLEDYMLMTKFPVQAVADLQGRKIGAPGPAVNWLKGTGAVGVSGNLTTYYNDLQSGVIEGVVVFPTAAVPGKLAEQAPYITITNFGAQYAGALVAKKSWFDQQPEAIQNAVRAGAKAYSAAYRTGLEARVKGAYKALEEAGVKISPLPAEERSKWAASLPNVPKEWASGLDGQGLAGTDTLKAYMELLRKSGADLPRNWDAE